MPKYFPCTVCGEKFTSFSEIRRHKEEAHRTVHREQRAPPPAAVSTSPTLPHPVTESHTENLSLTQDPDQTQLEAQTKQHYVRKYCPICNELFANTWDLKQHHLSQHVEHEDGRIFHRCPSCSHRFHRRFVLLRHHQEKHGKTPIRYRCYFCGVPHRNFDTQQALEEHIQTVHVSHETRQGHFGFQRLQSAFRGRVSSFAYPFQDLPLTQRLSFNALLANQDLLTRARRLIEDQVRQNNVLKLSIIVHATFDVVSGEGTVLDRVNNLPLRAPNVLVLPQRLPHMNTIIVRSLRECQHHAEELEGLKGSGWKLVSLNSMTLEFITVRGLATVLPRTRRP